MLNVKKMLTKLANSALRVNNIDWMCCGAAVLESLPANSYADVTITFPSTAPSATPRVVANVRATSTAQNRSQIIPVHAAYSATGSTIRVFNNSSTTFTSVTINWIAMA